MSEPIIEDGTLIVVTHCENLDQALGIIQELFWKSKLKGMIQYYTIGHPCLPHQQAFFDKMPIIIALPQDKPNSRIKLIQDQVFYSFVVRRHPAVSVAEYKEFGLLCKETCLRDLEKYMRGVIAAPLGDITDRYLSFLARIVGNSEIQNQPHLKFLENVSL